MAKPLPNTEANRELVIAWLLETMDRGQLVEFFVDTMTGYFEHNEETWREEAAAYQEANNG